MCGPYSSFSHAVRFPAKPIETVAQQKDPMRRTRADKAPRMGSVIVLSARYRADLIARLGLEPIPKDCFISVPISRQSNALAGADGAESYAGTASSWPAISTRSPADRVLRATESQQPLARGAQGTAFPICLATDVIG